MNSQASIELICWIKSNWLHKACIKILLDTDNSAVPLHLLLVVKMPCMHARVLLISHQLIITDLCFDLYQGDLLGQQEDEECRKTETTATVMCLYTSDISKDTVEALGEVLHALQVVLIPYSFCSTRLVLMATVKLTFQSKLQMQFHFCQESRPCVTAYSDADQRLRPMSKLTSTPSVKENNCWFAADWGSVGSSHESLYAVWCVYQRSVKAAHRTTRKMIKAFLFVLLQVSDKLNCTFYDLWCHSSPHECPNQSKLSL